MRIGGREQTRTNEREQLLINSAFVLCPMREEIFQRASI
jgi:hypothetical protein